MPSGLTLGLLRAPNSPESRRDGLTGWQILPEQSSRWGAQFNEEAAGQSQSGQMTRPETFESWAEQALPGLWTPAAHLLLLLSYLDKLERREIRKLMITMPPRHAKSTTVNQLWLPRYIMEHPEERIILTSYESDFARKWGDRKSTRLNSSHRL